MRDLSGRRSFAVQDYAAQLAASLQAAAIRQQRIVGENGADAGQQRVGSVAHAMHFGARFFDW